MNIWIINQYVRLPEQGGGTRHFQLSRELIKQGHDVTLIASPISYLTGQPEPGVAPGIQQKDGVRLVWLESPSYQGNSIARVWNMLIFSVKVRLGRYRSRLPKPDVIVGSSPHLLAAFAAERLAKAETIPFVMEVRDLWPQTLIDVGGISPSHPIVILFRWLERRCYRSATKIVALLPAAWRYIEKHGAASGAVCWIPNGVDLGDFRVKPAPLRSGQFIVTYAGTHGLANALDSVLDAAALLNNEGLGDRVRFRLIGEGAEKARLVSRVRYEELRMVEFLDPVPKLEIASVLAQSDAFIAVIKDSPLYQWGISLNKLFDYLAMARPVIFSGDVPDNPVLESGGGIVVPAEDPQAIAGAVKELLAMKPEERVAMGRAGLTFIQQHHSISLLAARLENVLLDAIHQ